MHPAAPRGRAEIQLAVFRAAAGRRHARAAQRPVIGALTPILYARGVNGAERREGAALTAKVKSRVVRGHQAKLTG